VDSLKLVNYTRLENVHNVRKQIFVVYYAAVICTIIKGKEQIRVCVCRYDLEIMHIFQAHVCNYISTKKTKQ